MLLSRRLSIGMGYDGSAKEFCFDDTNVGRVLLDNDFSLFSQEDFESEWHDNDASACKKRRLSQCGSIYLVHDIDPLPGSSPELVSSRQQDASHMTAHKDALHETGEALRVSYRGGSNEPADVSTVKDERDNQLAELWKWVDSKALQAFQKAMTHSELSRQDIHKFDGKMDQTLLLLSTMNQSSTSHKRLCVGLPAADTTVNDLPEQGRSV